MADIAACLIIKLVLLGASGALGFTATGVEVGAASLMILL
jgi:hypothetical protein